MQCLRGWRHRIGIYIMHEMMQKYNFSHTFKFAVNKANKVLYYSLSTATHTLHCVSSLDEITARCEAAVRRASEVSDVMQYLQKEYFSSHFISLRVELTISWLARRETANERFAFQLTSQRFNISRELRAALVT